MPTGVSVTFFTTPVSKSANCRKSAGVRSATLFPPLYFLLPRNFPLSFDTAATHVPLDAQTCTTVFMGYADASVFALGSRGLSFVPTQGPLLPPVPQLYQLTVPDRGEGHRFGSVEQSMSVVSFASVGEERMLF